MRPMKIRSVLLLLTLGTLVPLVLLAAAAAWIIGNETAPMPGQTAWFLGTGIAAACTLSILLTLRLARALSGPLASLAALARSLSSEPKGAPPAPVRIAEIAEAREALTAAGQITRAREQAMRAAERAKEEFVAMLSHELRNPLGALAAAAQVLGRLGAQDGAEKPGPAAQAIDVVGRQVEHMSRLVEDLLDVSRVARGKLSLSRQALDLAPLVEKTVLGMRASGKLDAHNVRLELSSAWVRADEARTAQIVANLVGNAVKYTPEGGRIGVTVRRDGNQAVLRVQDSGIGMAPELAARVFDLFVQGEGSVERGAGGLGIGLALVKHLADLQGGKVFAASSGPGQGSVFTVALPIIEAGTKPSATPLAPAAERRRHKIVLIEDNNDARRTLMSALAMDGHQVYEAIDGTAGIRVVGEVHPEIAVIDIGLPGLNGYQVAQSLRATPELDGTVLIALTGFGQPDSARRAQEAGFDEYVTKPIAPDRLVRLMDVAIAAKGRRARPAAH